MSVPPSRALLAQARAERLEVLLLEEALGVLLPRSEADHDAAVRKARVTTTGLRERHRQASARAHVSMHRARKLAAVVSEIEVEPGAPSFTQDFARAYALVLAEDILKGRGWEADMAVALEAVS